MGDGIGTALAAILKRLQAGQSGAPPPDMPRMGGADEARALLNTDDPTTDSNRLMYGADAARIMQPGGDPSRAMPTDGMTRLPMPNQTGTLPRMGNDIPPNIGRGMGMPMPQQAGGDWKSRLLHAGQGALMGLANARRNPTNPNDWGAVVGSAIGGGAAGAISPQSIENEKYYERDLPRW